MSLATKQAHNQWIDNYKAKGGATTEYICGHCDNPIEVPKPSLKDVDSEKPYWDGMKECPDCGGHNFVKTYPNGDTEIAPVD